ncbi:MAG: glycosyltransferase family 39 protein [Spirosomataceae bacterium]
MNKKLLLLLCLVLAKFVIQYALISPAYELHRDEFLHLDQGDHLAWGYLSVPPVTSWISFIIKALGNGVFWVKFFPCLFGALTLIVVWKTVELLKGSWFAFLLGGLSVLFSVILRINTLYQPNSLDILLWTSFYYTLLRYFSDNQAKWLWIAAIILALGFLNKYNILFLVLGLTPALLLTPQRRIFLNKYLYGALALALLLVLPNLIWQYTHGFPVISHLDALANIQLVNVNRIDFLKEQLLYFFGAFFVLIAGWISLVVYPPFRSYRFLAWSLLCTLAIFVYFKAKSYYAIGLYPIYLAFGAVYLEQLLAKGWKRYLRLVAIAVPIVLFVPLIHVVFPVDEPAVIKQNAQRFKALNLLRWEDGKDHDLPQDFADMQGWKELAQKVEKAYQAIPDKEHTLVLCDNYGQAGAINFYTNGRLKAYSMHADYKHWIPLDKPILNVILVKNADDDDVSRAEEKPLFESITHVSTVENEFAREKGTRIFVLLRAKIDVNQRLRGEIAENVL